jgi:hypothetical protein
MCNQNDAVKEDEMGRPCSRNLEEEQLIWDFGEKPTFCNFCTTF